MHSSPTPSTPFLLAFYAVQPLGECPRYATRGKNLLWIERLFRDLKHLLETRPIYHHWVKDNVKGHIFGCFLALYLVVVLRKKIAALGRSVEWDDLLRDLSQLRAIGLRLDDRAYLLRTELRGDAHVAFQAVGLRPPPLAQVLETGPGQAGV
jgi:hypothetical protein